MTPMRHEEYLAMAEENRRLKQGMEKLLNKPARMKARQGLFKSIGIVLLMAICCYGISCIFHSWSSWRDEVKAKDSISRTTACYFTRHRISEDYDKSAYAWQPWHIYMSRCEGCDNQVLFTGNDRGTVLQFASKDDAWNFMIKWKLEPCK